MLDRPIYKNFRHCARRILAEEGFRGLWLPGLGASLMREFSYSSFRLGMYPTFKRLVGGEGGDVGLSNKIAAGRGILYALQHSS